MEFLQRLAEIVLAHVQLKLYDRDLLSKYETLFDTDLFGMKEILSAYEELMEGEAEENKKYRALVELCGGTETAGCLLAFCLTALLYPEFQEFAQEYWGGVTLDAVSGYSEEENVYKSMKKTAECADRILRCQKKEKLFLRHQFWVDARLLDYFLDEYAIDVALKKIGAKVFTGEDVLEDTFV